MITKFRISNFKRLEGAELDLGSAAVFIGPNNSGKTTALQAMALWDVGCKRWAEKRDKSSPTERTGVTINRRDLYSIPVPSAKLLWKDLHTHEQDRSGAKPKTGKVFITLTAEGVHDDKPWICTLEFYYANEESFYCRLKGSEDGLIPEAVRRHNVVFLPPMSGLAEREHRKESGEISVLIGEGQTAQVLRNLCWQLFSREDKRAWLELVARVDSLFHITLKDPTYVKERAELSLTYKERSGVELDLSSAGRGCQQVLLLLSYMLANPNAVLLLDEPDAHLEILRQRDVYNLLTEIAAANGSQIVAASHSEIILQEAAERDVVMAFVGKPQEARDHFQGLREAKPDLVGIALFDRLDRELHGGSQLTERMWSKREIECYLVTPESLLAYVGQDLREDDLIEQAELRARQETLQACLAEIVNALRLTNKPDPWGPDIKVTDDFLDPLFKLYYERLGIPQQTFKRDYHGLADAMPLASIDPEVHAVLDSIAETAKAATPAT